MQRQYRGEPNKPSLEHSAILIPIISKHDLWAETEIYYQQRLDVVDIRVRGTSISNPMAHKPRSQHRG